MPIVIKDYTWRQTTDAITLQVPLRGVHQSKVDAFTSPRYIKAKYEKNFFEVVLLHPIDMCKSKCVITPTDIIYELKKVDEVIWESLEPNIPKAEKQALKKRLLDEEFVRIKGENEQKASKRTELKRTAVREQIETDSRERKHIEDIKKEEETNALGDIHQWTATLSPKNSKVIDNECNNRNKYASPNKTPVTVNRTTISNKISRQLNQTNNKPVEPVPLPRSTKTLEIEFTPREFPTPCRESRLEEENEWLRKQAAARRSAGFISEDIRPEERSPQFLKAKGDEFLKNKNYLAAISAYSFGIKLSEKFVDLYISRSEAHLSVGNFNKTIQDCSTALNLLKPEVPMNLKERAICIGRRGEALCQFRLRKQGIEELKFSLKLVPDEHFQDVLEKALKEADKSD